MYPDAANGSKVLQRQHIAVLYLYSEGNVPRGGRGILDQRTLDSSISSTLPEHLPVLQRAFDKGGIRAFWLKLIDIRQDEQAAKEAACARYYALLGDREAAVRGLKRAVEQRVFGVLYCEPIRSFANSSRTLNLVMRSAGLIKN